MGRHRNKATGVVVSVSDEKDGRFDEGWESADSQPSPVKRGPGRPKKSEQDQ